jgi:hypothetical protein
MTFLLCLCIAIIHGCSLYSEQNSSDRTFCEMLNVATQMCSSEHGEQTFVFAESLLKKFSEPACELAIRQLMAACIVTADEYQSSVRANAQYVIQHSSDPFFIACGWSQKAMAAIKEGNSEECLACSSIALNLFKQSQHPFCQGNQSMAMVHRYVLHQSRRMAYYLLHDIVNENTERREEELCRFKLALTL